MSRLVCAVAAAALMLAGCGGESEEDKRTKRDPDFAKHSSADVKKRFNEITEVELKGGGGNQLLESLRVDVDPSDDSGAYDRYGGVNITVTGNEYTLKTITDRPATGERKIIDNVVVDAIGTSRGEESFERTVQVLSSLGKPASTVKLAPEDTPCEKAGIDPEGGSGEKEGECLNEDQKPLTIVNSDSELEVDGRTVSDVAVKAGPVLTSRRFGLTRRFRARGAFVAVSYEVENTGDEPLSSLRPNLVVDGKSYSEDTRRSFYVQPADAFPLQPGATTRAVTLFDIPTDAARDATDDGVLEISGDEDGGSTQYADSIGRIRLDGAQAPRRRGGSGVTS